MANPIPDNTVLLMHMDENLKDESGLNVPSVGTGTINYESGKFSRALKLNGSSCVKIPYGDNIVFGSANFTIACWVKQNSRTAGGTSQRVFSHQYRYNPSYKYYGLRIEVGQSGMVTFAFQTVYSQETKINTSYTLPLNTWVHLALVRGEATIACYADGVKIGNSSVSGTLYQNSSASFKIGAGTNESASNDDPYNFWSGAIDEFIVVKGRALWTSNFTPPTEPYGTALHIFKSGIVGQTNIVEGQEIMVNGPLDFNLISVGYSTITEESPGVYRSICTKGGRADVNGQRSYNGSILLSTDAVNLKNVNSIKARFAVDSYTVKVIICVKVSSEPLYITGDKDYNGPIPEYVPESLIAQIGYGTDNTTFPVTAELDVSTLSGSYYIAVSMYSYDTSGSRHNGTISEITLL